MDHPTSKTRDVEHVIPVTGYARLTVLSVLAAFGGAGISVAPLYERIWGGMMLHPACPAVDRASYYDTVMNAPANAGQEYGMCVTPPLWFAGVAVLSVTLVVMALVVAALLTVPDSVRRRPIRRIAEGVAAVCVCGVCVAAIWYLSGNPAVGIAQTGYVLLWLAYGLLHGSPHASSNEPTRAGSPHAGAPVPAAVRRVWPSLMVGAFPVLMTEYALSDEVTFSGGVLLSFALTLIAFAIISMIVDADARRRGPFARIAAMAGWCCAAALAAGWLLGPLTGSGKSDFCPALSSTGNGGLRAYCIGTPATMALAVAAMALLALSGVILVGGVAGLAVATAASATVPDESSLSNGSSDARMGMGDRANRLTASAALLTVAFVIAFILA